MTAATRRAKLFEASRTPDLHAYMPRGSFFAHLVGCTRYWLLLYSTQGRETWNSLRFKVFDFLFLFWSAVRSCLCSEGFQNNPARRIPRGTCCCLHDPWWSLYNDGVIAWRTACCLPPSAVRRMGAEHRPWGAEHGCGSDGSSGGRDRTARSAAVVPCSGGTTQPVNRDGSIAAQQQSPSPASSGEHQFLPVNPATPPHARAHHRQRHRHRRGRSGSGAGGSGDVGSGRPPWRTKGSDNLEVQTVLLPSYPVDSVDAKYFR